VVNESEAEAEEKSFKILIVFLFSVILDLFDVGIYYALKELNKIFKILHYKIYFVIY